MASPDVQAPASSEHQDTAMTNNISPSPRSLSELLKADLLIRAYKRSREFYHDQVEGLHEARERIEFEIEQTEEELQDFDAGILRREIERLDAVEKSGLSAELMQAYNAFCESLNGADGSQAPDGFSILCGRPHGGSYFGYDPAFRFFKEFVEPEKDVDVEFEAPDEDSEEVDRETKIVSGKNLEMASQMDVEEDSEETPEDCSEMNSEVFSELNSERDSRGTSELTCKEVTDDGYNARNFRCEASVSHGGTQWEEQIVEFWPLHRIKPRSGVEATWGEQYPKLYRLAIRAAKKGSEAAMEMLIRLPSMNAAFSGWLLEYEFAEELKDEFLVSRRWVFRQARKIDEPGRIEEKREAVESLVAAY